MHISFTCLFLWNGDKQSSYQSQEITYKPSCRHGCTLSPHAYEITTVQSIQYEILMTSNQQVINQSINQPIYQKVVILLTWMIHFEHQRDIGLLITNQKLHYLELWEHKEIFGIICVTFMSYKMDTL